MKGYRIFYGLLIFVALGLLLSSCRHKKQVNTSFYYWKTVYKNNPAESAYLHHFNVHKLYVRITDIGLNDDGIAPIPISPITFKDKLPDTMQIVPVVFIVNDALKKTDTTQLKILARKLVIYVNAKALQAGKSTYSELQIDCDWTGTTRGNYFYLLRQLAKDPLLNRKVISATLRLYQLKNQQACGIPPVNRVMLMCYNMGNLRKYGSQNSILDMSELKKYLGENISTYPLPVDVGLPLFKWAVAFRNKQYLGISKRIKIDDLDNKNQFIFIGNTLYSAVTDLPEFGLIKGDEVRWESISATDLQAAAAYISPLIKTDSLNLLYFHLDQAVVSSFKYEDLEKVKRIFN